MYSTASNLSIAGPYLKAKANAFTINPIHPAFRRTWDIILFLWYYWNFSYCNVNLDFLCAQRLPVGKRLTVSSHKESCLHFSGVWWFLSKVPEHSATLLFLLNAKWMIKYQHNSNLQVGPVLLVIPQSDFFSPALCEALKSSMNSLVPCS